MRPVYCFRCDELRAEIARLKSYRDGLLVIEAQKDAEIARLRAALTEIHEETQESNVPYYQIVQNVAACAKSALRDGEQKERT